VAYAIIYDRTNVAPGLLPDPISSGIIDTNFIIIGGSGSAGAMAATILAQSGCAKVIVLDEGRTIDFYDPYAPFHPGGEYDPTTGYFSGVNEKLWHHAPSPAIDGEKNVHGSTIRTIPGGSERLSHYALESGDDTILQREMYEALGQPVEWSPDFYYNVIPDQFYNFSGPHLTGNHANLGRLHIKESHPSVFLDTWLEACNTFTGNRIEYDFNQIGGSINTCGAEPSIIDEEGFRSTPENAYLIPEAQTNPNLIVIRNTEVHRIIFDQSTNEPVAIGVEGTFNGVYFKVSFPTRISVKPGLCTVPVNILKNLKRVVLATGTIQTAKLLKLSGVGPADELQSLGIPVILNNPHVGAHYKEGEVAYIGMNMNATAQEAGYQDGTDWTSSRPGAFVEIDGRKYLFLLTPSVFGEFSSAYLLVFQLEQPLEGSVTLLSANFGDLPYVNLGWTDEDTVAMLVKGLRTFRNLVEDTGLAARFDMQQYFPESLADDDETLAQAVREGSEPILHSTGTARMALSADDGVVDLNNAVFGVEGLDIISNAILRFFPGAGGMDTARKTGIIYAAKKLRSLGISVPWWPEN
jgi:choline dehydrogenase